MSEKLYQNNQYKYSDKKLDPLTCQLWVMMVDKLRYTRFISTKELEKLNTCNSLDELEKYFELEKKILKIIFLENPELEKELRFDKFLTIETKNSEILWLIEEYVSIDYIRANAKDFKDDNISWLRVFVQRDSKNRFYISNIEVVNK